MKVSDSRQDLIISKSKRKKRNWIIAGVVFVIAVALIVAAIILLKRGTGEDIHHPDQQNDETINLEDFLNYKYNPKSFNGTWVADEDWCSNQPNVDKATAISQLINKHQEQKEAFLKACTLARRTAETFLKYTTRSLQFYNFPNTSTNHESRVKGILEKLLSQENKVLEHWTQRKKRLDQCQQFVLFERSAKQAIEWIHDTGECYLTTHATNLGQIFVTSRSCDPSGNTCNNIRNGLERLYPDLSGFQCRTCNTNFCNYFNAGFIVNRSLSVLVFSAILSKLL